MAELEVNHYKRLYVCKSLPPVQSLCIHPRKYQTHSYTPTANDVHLKAVDTFAFQLTYLSVQNLTVSSIDKQKKSTSCRIYRLVPADGLSCTLVMPHPADTLGKTFHLWPSTYMQHYMQKAAGCEHTQRLWGRQKCSKQDRKRS